MRQAATLLLASGASGHAALSFPRPRNAADGSLAPWTSWAYPCDKTHSGANCSISFCEHGHDCQGSCPIAARSGVKGALTASNGQACYWFSNGCTVGCARCDGSSNHVGHGSQRFLFKGMSAAALRARNLSIEDPFSPPPGALALNQTTAKSLAIAPNCADPKTAPTVCDPRLRTANTQAACGSKEDVYYYSPWRAPGAAPVIDACGMAGGRFPGQGVGGAGAQFQNSSVMRQGDAGSALPRGPPAAVWRPRELETEFAPSRAWPSAPREARKKTLHALWQGLALNHRALSSPPPGRARAVGVARRRLPRGGVDSHGQPRRGLRVPAGARRRASHREHLPQAAARV